VEGPPSSSLQGAVDHGLGGPEGVPGPLGGQHKSLVVSSGADSDNLLIDESVEPLGVDILEVAWLGGEGLLYSSLLEQEAAGITDDGPCDVGGNHL